MSSRCEERCSSSADRRRMTGCGSGALCLVPLLWLAAAAATVTTAAATVSTRFPASQSASVCQQQKRPLGGSPLRPTNLWQFADASVSAVADSCYFTIDAPPESTTVTSTSRGAATTPAAAAAVVVTQSYSSLSNASDTPPAPQLLVVRLISWHPGSECLSETCSRNTSMSLRGDGGRCAVAMSLAPRSSSSFASAAQLVGASDSLRSVEMLLISRGGGGAGSSPSSPASAAATIAWFDAALSANVSGSGCCGARLLLGYKVAPARSACRSAANPSTGSSLLSSSSSSSDAPPSSDTSSPNQYSTPELVGKYTYMFAQDRKLGRLPPGTAADAATSVAACRDGEDYELIILPAAAEAASAKQELRFHLLTAPTRLSCRRLCIADDCSPRLGVFNTSGGRPLSVRYEYRPVAATAAADSGGACVEREYSGFTLRLLSPSRIQFAAFVSPLSSPSPGASYKPDWVLIIALATGGAAILIVLIAVIAVPAVRRRLCRQSATANMGMLSMDVKYIGQLPLLASDAADDNDRDRYDAVRFN